MKRHTREPLTLGLAREIAALRHEDLSAVALARSKICIADAIGVALAGSREAATQVLLRTPGVAAGNSARAGQGEQGRQNR